MKTIQSRDNPFVKTLRKLGESARARREAGLTLLDGVHLVEAACDAGVVLADIVVSDAALGRAEVARLLQRLPQTPYLLPAALFDTLSPVETPTGLLATLPLPSAAPPAPCDQDWLVLDGVQDAGNVGALIRTAVAAGVRHVLLGPGCAQAWSPKVLRAGMGAHFSAVLHENVDLCGTLVNFQGQVNVTRLDGACSLYACDLRGPQAWVVGAEGQGVRPEVAVCATQGVLIPMANGVESLNVGAAAAICLFEQWRQRMA